jgi:hypothetical protein
MRLVFAFTLLGLAGCYPHRDLAADQIPSLSKLEVVMDVQATVADPLFKKIGQPSYTDADWAAFTDASNRLQVSSTHLKDFNKGDEFDALAMLLNSHAKELGTAASAKDAAASSKALADMKDTCKTCHKKFK